MTKIFAANWKLFKTPKETRQFFSDWKKQVSGASKDQMKDQILFFPPATNLEATAQSVEGTGIQWGSQNCYSEIKGAFTGEISALVVKELGGSYVLLGHSERRSLFHETNEGIAKKVALVQSLDLTPLLCIGETLTERQSGKTMQVLKTQLEQSLSLADPKKNLVVAYEPVWAIGTGQVATAAQVQETHLETYKLIQKMGFPEKTAILYGGSVKPDNAKELISIPHVDGFLVGGASLEVPSFLQICKSTV
jgi:triosephosphate isomerase